MSLCPSQAEGRNYGRSVTTRQAEGRGGRHGPRPPVPPRHSVPGPFRSLRQEGPNSSTMLQKRHFFGRPFFLSLEAFRSLFRQTHRLSKPSTATGVAGQRFFLPPRPPVSAGAFF